MQEWLKKILGEFSVRLTDAYGLKTWATLDLDQYPVARNELRLREELKGFLNTSPGSMDVLAMLVRDIFWSAVVLATDTECPSCGDSCLAVLHDEADDRLVLSCDLCSFATALDGNEWRGSTPLQVPTRAVLARLAGN